MIWLALGWLKGAAGALFGIIRRYPCQMALLALCGLSLWLWQGKASALRDRDSAIVALADQAKAYKAAQAEAAAKAIAAREADERRTTDLAERTDHAKDRLLADARARAADFARRNRLLQAAGGASCRPAAPGQDDAPQDPDRPGDAAEMVIVPRNDFDTLTENSIRLEAAHDWAKALVKNGYATEIPDPTF